MCSHSWGLLCGLTIGCDPFHAYFQMGVHSKYLLVEVNWVSLWFDDPEEVTGSPNQGRMQRWFLTHLYALAPQPLLNSAITKSSFLHPCPEDPWGKQNSNLATGFPPAGVYTSSSRLLIKCQSTCCCEGSLQMEFQSYINWLKRGSFILRILT